MSTRNCSRCDGVCHGCDNQDEPHICERCKESDMEKPATKKPQLVVTRLKVVTSVNVPDFSGKERFAIGHVAVPLDPPVTLWLLSAQDDASEWKETYATEIEKDAFVRGFLAASSMHGEVNPVVVEVQRQEL